MKHEAKTEEEINEMGLLEDGIYDFTIIEAEETTSKKGKDMFKLKLHIFDTKGEPLVIFDWVLPDFPKKYKHLHDACGLLDLYQSGETKSGDLVGNSGKLLLGKGKPYTDSNGIERINNSVVDYVKKDNLTSYAGAAAKAAAALDDEIPF